MEKLRCNIRKILFKNGAIVNNVLERIWKETVVAQFNYSLIF